MGHRLWVPSALVGLLAAHLAACSGGGSSSRTIGPEGGRVEGPDGVVLEIPAGALDAEEEFSIEVTSTPSSLPFDLVGRIYDIGPSGTQFLKPATLTIPYDAAALPSDTTESELALYSAPDADGTWQPLPGSAEGGKVTGTLEHLSLAGIGHTITQISTLQGSVWNATFVLAANNLVTPPGPDGLVCNGPVTITYTVEFEIGDSTGGSSGTKTFELKTRSLTASLDYEQIAGESGDIQCGSAKGSFDYSSIMLFEGTYEFRNKELLLPDWAEVGMLTNGSPLIPHHTFRFSVLPADDETILSGPSHIYDIQCTNVDGDSWSEQRVPGVPWGVLGFHEARDQSLVWSESNGETITMSAMELSCLQNCIPLEPLPTPEPDPDPDPPEDDPCDPATFQKRCDQALEAITEFCQTLQDSYTVMTDVDGVVTTNCFGDCTGAISKNETGKRWVGVTDHWSQSCSTKDEDLSCQVECYGWQG